MDLNRILLWLVLPAILIAVVRLLRTRARAATGWLGVVLVTAGVTVWALAVVPEKAGLIGGGLWGLLVIVPVVGLKLVQRLAMRAPSANTATALLFSLHSRWEEFDAWLAANRSAADLRDDPSLLATGLRALGETGDLNGLVRLYASHEARLTAAGLAVPRDLCRLMLFSFCGRRAQVERLLQGGLRLYPEEVRRFWLATATQAAGDAENARQELQGILGYCRPRTRAAVERRLAHCLANPEQVLDADSRAVLARQEMEALHEAHFGERPAGAPARPSVTWVLIGLNLAAFALEMLAGGSTDALTLYRLGALHAGAVCQGEWWRVVTASFLHFGSLHLLLNMLGLYLLGPFVEYNLGARRYAATYLLSGMGSMLALVLLAAAGLLGAGSFCVGASGSIMGLVGATAAVLLRAWRHQRSRVLSRRLSTIGLAILAQVVFDVTTPQVSFTAHAAGVLLGFLGASLLKHRASAPQSAVAGAT